MRIACLDIYATERTASWMSLTRPYFQAGLDSQSDLPTDIKRALGPNDKY